VALQGEESGEISVTDAAGLDNGNVPPVQAAIAMQSPFDRGEGSAVMAERPGSGDHPGSTPHLVIGRIDVVVVTKEATSGARPTLSTRSDSGFVSRNYLKRL
jgi:hypothetical protein